MRRFDRRGELWAFLETLPGVGAKLIECLRVFSFAYPGVPLDTHNWKVMWQPAASDLPWGPGTRTRVARGLL